MPMNYCPECGTELLRKRTARQIGTVGSAASGRDLQKWMLGDKAPKRKLSAWNKFVKANSKKPRFRYRNGKLNLKKMAVAFRKTPAGKKKRR